MNYSMVKEKIKENLLIQIDPNDLCFLQLLNPVELYPSPGKILASDFIYLMNWDLKDFAKHIGLTEGWLSSICSGKNRILFEMAVWMGEALGMDPKY